MYLLMLVALLALSAWLVAGGLRADRRLAILAGLALGLATVAVFALLSFWGEMLWFEALGYRSRFWTFVLAEGTAMIAGMLLAAALAVPISWPTGWAVTRWGAVVASALTGLWWGAQSWERLLLYLNRVATGHSEPVFGMDTGFYLFTLPFLDELHDLLLLVAWIGLAAALVATFDWRGEGEPTLRDRRRNAPEPFLPLLVAAAALALVLALGRVLEAFHLLYSEWGVVAGPGWTDVHVRLPAYLIMAAVLLLVAILPLLPAVRRWLGRRLAGLLPVRSPAAASLIVVWVAAAALWFAGVGGSPALIQWLVVEPNEITFEAPYIARNIDFTRRGFRLDEVEERQFPAVEKDFDRQAVQANRHLLSEVRLWDWRALDAVYKQFQEIRLYYEFVDVDMDRYHFGGRYRQIMASARELAQENLPAQSQTFVNQRFKYTHGYGLTLATVSDFTPEGLPNLLVKDLPPQSRYPELEVTRPQIYYGELTTGPAVVNSDEQEFDHPSGENNVYIRYPGRGGVQISNLWRKFVFGWKFDGARLLLSTYPNPDSRMMFHRQIRERVQRVAPFLELDEDPYIVLDDGKLYWIVDAYTTSDYYPYSEPFSSDELVEYRGQRGTLGFVSRAARHLDGANYARNSVKAVVDAFHGSVDLYVFEPEDPLILAWQRALPHLFQSQERMPEGLRAHVRYPQDFLLAQGLVYAKYHMTDPEVFYNQEDLWVRATEKHYDRVQPVEPYYVMWELPGSDQAEFVLILPFTPKNRQVLIGWIAGLSDGDNYGRFLAYKFPKEKRVLGPQQVETKIDQDSFLSGQLTLWDQRGSNVIRGNVLAIPIDNRLLYVEPIYLQAETAAYPELRLVVVMHGDTMSYAESFDEALRGLYQEGAAPGLGATATLDELAGRANEAFEAYLDALGERRFEEAAGHLKTLEDLLGRLSDRSGRAPRKAPGAPSPKGR
jgi:uncharacterized membrane protein (UPF0182 family)